MARDVLRFMTAGSVDDGKSTLIGRLLYDTKALLADQLSAVARTSRQRGSELDLSLVTDGLLAEREQGITIDVAYRYFATASRRYILADAPGHEQYTRNMVTAASTAQAAILLIDARHGVVDQTRRHAKLADLLGVPHLVVAVNKMDLVDYAAQRFEDIVDGFAAFARRAGLRDVRYVPMSALHGDMVVERGAPMSWYGGPTLLQILETLTMPHPPPAAPFRFPVQYVARPTGSAPRGYLGRVESGIVRVGDRIVVFPSGTESRVRSIRTFDGELAQVGVNASVTLVLDDALDIGRGDMLLSAEHPMPARRELDAMACWLADAPLAPRRKYLLRHTTREVAARVRRIEHRWDVATQQEEPAPAHLRRNDIGRIVVDLAQPVCADRYADNRATGAFILIDEGSNATVAAGMIQ